MRKIDKMPMRKDNKSAQECEVDIRRDLYGNIILSGGTTLYEGLPDRLEKELDALCP